MSVVAWKVRKTSVTVRAPHQVGVCKKHKVMLKATIKEEGDNAMWVPLPAPKVVGTAESPFEKALVGIMKEMKASQKSSERIAWDALEVLRESGPAVVAGHAEPDDGSGGPGRVGSAGQAFCEDKGNGSARE